MKREVFVVITQCDWTLFQVWLHSQNSEQHLFPVPHGSAAAKLERQWLHSMISHVNFFMIISLAVGRGGTQTRPTTVTHLCTNSGATAWRFDNRGGREGHTRSEGWGARWEGKIGRENEIEGQTRFPLDGLAAENVPLLGKWLRGVGGGPALLCYYALQRSPTAG